MVEGYKKLLRIFYPRRTAIPRIAYISVRTTGWKKERNTGTGDIIDREFSYVTPENDFKQATAHPKPGHMELGTW